MTLGDAVTITYRSNKTGTLHAAYCGACRVGYVEMGMFQWRWQLIVLKPEGGAYWGRGEDEQDAKDRLEKNFQHWMTSAGLKEKNG